MTKKTISLQTLLNLMEYLEKDISNQTNFVISNNAVLKTKKSDVIKNKVKEHYTKRKKCIEQLQVFKLAKSKANMEIQNDVENNARIFELSDLKRNERFINILIGQKSRVRKGKQDDYSFYIPKSELEEELQKIEERISELKEQMSNFNETFQIEVQVYEDLDLI